MARDIDQIIERLRTEIPGVHVAQLRVRRPEADDDGLWFIEIPGRAERWSRPTAVVHSALSPTSMRNAFTGTALRRLFQPSSGCMPEKQIPIPPFLR